MTELCGAKRLGFFTTPQFFVALKLLAAVQSERPLQLESITASKGGGVQEIIPTSRIWSNLDRVGVASLGVQSHRNPQGEPVYYLEDLLLTFDL